VFPSRSSGEGKALAAAGSPDENFTFLGYRALRPHRRMIRPSKPVAGSGLGVCLRDAPEAAVEAICGISPAKVRAKGAREGRCWCLTKAETHGRDGCTGRPHLDYIGIKRYDAHGRGDREHRFIGLYAFGAP